MKVMILLGLLACSCGNYEDKGHNGRRHKRCTHSFYRVGYYECVMIDGYEYCRPL